MHMIFFASGKLFCSKAEVMYCFVIENSWCKVYIGKGALCE